MTHVFKVLAIFVFMTAVTACGVNPNKQQPVAEPYKSSKKHDIHIDFNFDAGNDKVNRISGFRIYQEGKLICETNDPRSTRIDCSFVSPSGSYLFTMTTHYDDGSESRHSEPFSYTVPE